MSLIWPSRSSMLWPWLTYTSIIIPNDSFHNFLLSVALFEASIIILQRKHQECFILIPISGKSFTLTQLSMMLTAFFFFKMAFIRIRKFHSIPSFNVFIMKSYWITSSDLFASIEMIMWYFSFSLLIWCLH